jgi:hypothetical protein
MEQICGSPEVGLKYVQEMFAVESAEAWGLFVTNAPWHKLTDTKGMDLSRWK